MKNCLVARFFPRSIWGYRHLLASNALRVLDKKEKEICTSKMEPADGRTAQLGVLVHLEKIGTCLSYACLNRLTPDILQRDCFGYRSVRLAYKVGHFVGQIVCQVLCPASLIMQPTFSLVL